MFKASGLIISAMLVMAALGCHRAPAISIPLQENAGKQYAYAVQARDDANLALIGDTKKLMKKRALVREHYAKVVEFFSGDRKYTPLAKLDIIEMDATLDMPRRLTPARGDLHKAITRLGDLSREYPEYEYIQAKALFDQGECYRKLRDYAKAQNCFLQVRDRFLNSKNKEIRDLARISGMYYNQTYTNEK